MLVVKIRRPFFPNAGKTHLELNPRYTGTFKHSKYFVKVLRGRLWCTRSSLFAFFFFCSYYLTIFWAALVAKGPRAGNTLTFRCTRTWNPCKRQKKTIRKLASSSSPTFSKGGVSGGGWHRSRQELFWSAVHLRDVTLRLWTLAESTVTQRTTWINIITPIFSPPPPHILICDL